MAAILVSSFQPQYSLSLHWTFPRLILVTISNGSYSHLFIPPTVPTHPPTTPTRTSPYHPIAKFPSIHLFSRQASAQPNSWHQADPPIIQCPPLLVSRFSSQPPLSNSCTYLNNHQARSTLTTFTTTNTTMSAACTPTLQRKSCRVFLPPVNSIQIYGSLLPV